MLNHHHYGVDRHFAALCKRLAASSPEALQAGLLVGFRRLSGRSQQILQRYFDRYPFWGSLHPERGDLQLIEQRAAVLHAHQADWQWLYQRLGDYRSKLVLDLVLHNWADFSLLDAIKEPLFSDYFDLDLIHCDENEVFVDLGAYTGDTVRSYLANYGENNYRQIYCYEITPQIFAQLQQNLRAYPRISCRACGAAAQSGLLYLDENGDLSANVLAVAGSRPVPTVAIDEDIDESVTFLKMDIEGSEQAALQGCRRQIANHAPKLAISLYHRHDDLWQIPRLVEEYNPGYDFYLRYYGGNLTPTELTLLAVPRAAE